MEKAFAVFLASVPHHLSSHVGVPSTEAVIPASTFKGCIIYLKKANPSSSFAWELCAVTLGEPRAILPLSMRDNDASPL